MKKKKSNSQNIKTFYGYFLRYCTSFHMKNHYKTRHLRRTYTWHIPYSWFVWLSTPDESMVYLFLINFSLIYGAKLCTFSKYQIMEPVGNPLRKVLSWHNSHQLSVIIHLSFFFRILLTWNNWFLHSVEIVTVAFLYFAGKVSILCDRKDETFLLVNVQCDHRLPQLRLELWNTQSLLDIMS